MSRLVLNLNIGTDGDRHALTSIANDNPTREQDMFERIVLRELVDDCV